MDDNKDPPERGVTVEETCHMLGVRHTKIYGMIASGDLRAAKIGRRTVVLISSIQAILAGPAHQQIARKCLAAGVSSAPREVAFLRQMMRAATITEKQRQWLDKIAARMG